MRRSTRIITIAVCLGILGAILPTSAVIWLAWSQALSQEQKTLTDYSSNMMQKMYNSFNVARGIFSVLQNAKVLQPCSKEHLNMMLTQRISTEAKLVAYFENGIEKCSSYGVPSNPLIRQKAYFTMEDGLEVSLNVKPFPDLSVSMLELRKPGNYDVFIGADQLTDVVLPGDIQIAIVYNNTIISSKNHPSPTFVKKIIIDHLAIFDTFAPGQLIPVLTMKMHEKEHIFIAEHQLVSVSQVSPLFFIAIEPMSHLYNAFTKQLIMLMPFAVIISILIILLVIYYSRQQLTLRGDIIAAIKSHEFMVHYQPIIDTITNKCHGAESLIRWQRPDTQMIHPDLFIPIAEDMGLLPKITDEVINIIFDEMEDFLILNPSIHISINVGSSDIQSGRILKVLDEKFSHSKIKRNQIWIELTEQTLINLKSAKITLQKAHEKGHVILIDDFGTGYSSLSYLQELTVDILKIDKSFITSIGTEYVTSHVINAIIEMAKKLKLELIAEGVEKKTQYDFLKENHVDYIQGYIFSQPLPKNEFIQFCALYGDSCQSG